MKVENIRLDSYNGRPAVIANVIWENSVKAPQDIYVATLDPYADYLLPEAAVYAVGCLLPALHHGEERLLLEGELCPELREGLDTVIRFMKMGYEPQHPSIRIEADVQERPPARMNSARAALFFSGGIDSLFSLRDNRTRYPKWHPAFVKDGIMINGQNIESDDQPESFEAAVRALSEVTADADISLLPIYTNLRALESPSTFFINKFYGALLAAVSHAVSGRICSVSVSARDSIPGLDLGNGQTLMSYGYRPFIESYYSSHNLQIRHVGMTAGRLTKTRRVAQWPVGLDNIRVCQSNWPDENCGSCEKCLRAMLALTAIGALQKSRSFPIRHLTVGHIKNIDIPPVLIDDYRELVKPLKECGRPDLARAVKSIIARASTDQSSPETFIKKTHNNTLDGK